MACPSQCGMTSAVEILKTLPPETPLSAAYLLAIVEAIEGATSEPANEQNYSQWDDHRYIDKKTLADWIGELAISQRFEIAFTIVNQTEAHEVIVNVDKSSESVWEKRLTVLIVRQDHDVESLQRIGEFERQKLRPCFCQSCQWCTDWDSLG